MMMVMISAFWCFFPTRGLPQGWCLSDNQNHERWPFHTQKLLHTKPSHREAFTHRSFYTEKPEAFTQRSFYKQKVRTGKSLRREAFTHSSFYADMSLHRGAFTQKLYTESSLHRGAFTHRSFCAKGYPHRSFYTRKSLHTEAFTQGSLYTQKITETFTRRAFCIEKPVHREA